MPNTRRRLISHLTATGLLSLAPRTVLAATPTPSSAEGPFYPTRSMRFPDQDADLVRIAGAVTDAGGEIMFLRGRVLDRADTPVPDARVEIWQCDVNGRYLHTGDRADRPRDDAFQGFGVSVTDADGAYAFRTIKPVTYPGRTPHIHVKVFALGRELTTQFYLAGDPRNETDQLWRRMSPDERAAVEMTLTEDGNAMTTSVDIVV